MLQLAAYWGFVMILLVIGLGALRTLYCATRFVGALIWLLWLIVSRPAVLTILVVVLGAFLVLGHG